MLRRFVPFAQLYSAIYTGNGLKKIALETEVTNIAAIKLYERLGFLRSKRLHRYYLNGNSAFRFMLFVKESAAGVRNVYGHEYDENYPSRPPSA